jgi:hypothetical protein
MHLMIPDSATEHTETFEFFELKDKTPEPIFDHFGIEVNQQANFPTRKLHVRQNLHLKNGLMAFHTLEFQNCSIFHEYIENG